MPIPAIDTWPPDDRVANGYVSYGSHRAQDIAQTALEHLESAQTAVSRLLCWVTDVPDEGRARYTKASNAIELAECRLRGVFDDVKPSVDSL